MWWVLGVAMLLVVAFLKKRVWRREERALRDDSLTLSTMDGFEVSRERGAELDHLNIG